MSQDESGFGSEYAKSDRSSCRLCHNTISMGALRLAVYVQSPKFDGKIPFWYHSSCFFKKAHPKDVSTIRGFQNLRWEDQQWIKEKMGLAPSGSAAAAKRDKGDDDDDDDGPSERIESSASSYSVEYSKSNRSMCKKCGLKIERDAIRITMKVSKSNANGNYHLDCFVKNKTALGFKFDVKEVVGFDELDEKDQESVKKSFESVVEPEEKLKRKLDDKKSEDEESNGENIDPEAKRLKKEQEEKEKQLRMQSKEYWKLRDSLDKELPNDIIKTILEENDQNIYKTGRDDMLNLLCDCMYFGPLMKCPECHNGQLLCRDFAYKCTGNITEWTKCSYKTQDPARQKTLSIPSDLKSGPDAYTCLKNFKFESRKRVFEKSLDQLSAEKSEAKNEEHGKMPLNKLNFSSAGKLTRNNKQLKLMIERLGGTFKAEVNDITVAVISNQVEVDKKLKKIRDCESCKVHVVDEAICDELEKPLNPKTPLDIESLIAKYHISSWTPEELKTRMETCVKAHESKEVDKSDKYSIKSLGDGSGKIKMKVKGGAVVDPDSGLEDDGHVLIEASTKDPYSCVLGMVDISRGSNSFYKLQIIEHDKNKTWYLFRAWGRVGTTIGGNKLENYRNKDDVICAFEDLYLEKTGNEWSDRKSANKVPGKFFPLEMDYGEDEEKNGKKTISKNIVSKSSLAAQIQSLIRLIFDVEAMKQQMKEFEIDLNKMPLGKISSNQIKKAFNILTELTALIDSNPNQGLILDACNRFYTLIPHDFGLKKPTILSEKKLIKEKTDMLNNLLEIEIAFNILNTDGADDSEDPIDVHYKKLKCHMEVLDHNSAEFAHISEYVQNTHAKTHSGYKLEIEDAFKICREGEDSSFDKFKSLHNRKLLWHGSRLTNFAGILSQGLRIAPPEAPSTGYMFGKGVYFADMVSKSANYCFTSSANPTGLMLLCEVALGDMYERTHAEFVTKLPNGKHSTKGVGRTAPDPKGSIITPEGYEIPKGTGIEIGSKNSSLLYNEYIVYDTAQVRMKYLLRINFKYSY